MVFTCYDNNQLFFPKGIDLDKSSEALYIKEFFSPEICTFTLVQTHTRKRCVRGQVSEPSIIWKFKLLNSPPYEATVI